VQSLVDEGRLALEQARHPKWPSWSALHGGGIEPDLRLRDTQQGDRYLLCYDGLHTVLPDETLPDETLPDVLCASPDPDDAVRRLDDLANERGGPDKIACGVADVVRAADAVAITDAVAVADASAVSGFGIRGALPA
jgi:protein phosphatase